MPRERPPESPTALLKRHKTQTWHADASRLCELLEGEPRHVFAQLLTKMTPSSEDESAGVAEEESHVNSGAESEAEHVNDRAKSYDGRVEQYKGKQRICRFDAVSVMNLRTRFRIDVFEDGLVLQSSAQLAPPKSSTSANNRRRKKKASHGGVGEEAAATWVPLDTITHILPVPLHERRIVALVFCREVHFQQTHKTVQKTHMLLCNWPRREKQTLALSPAESVELPQTVEGPVWRNFDFILRTLCDAELICEETSKYANFDGPYLDSVEDSSDEEAESEVETEGKSKSEEEGEEHAQDEDEEKAEPDEWLVQASSVEPALFFLPRKGASRPSSAELDVGSADKVMLSVPTTVGRVQGELFPLRVGLLFVASRDPTFLPANEIADVELGRSFRGAQSVDLLVKLHSPGGNGEHEHKEEERPEDEEEQEGEHENGEHDAISFNMIPKDAVDPLQRYFNSIELGDTSDEEEEQDESDVDSDAARTRAMAQLFDNSEDEADSDFEMPAKDRRKRRKKKRHKRRRSSRRTREHSDQEESEDERPRKRRRKRRRRKQHSDAESSDSHSDNEVRISDGGDDSSGSDSEFAVPVRRSRRSRRHAPVDYVTLDQQLHGDSDSD